MHTNSQLVYNNIHHRKNQDWAQFDITPNFILISGTSHGGEASYSTGKGTKYQKSQIEKDVLGVGRFHYLKAFYI